MITLFASTSPNVHKIEIMLHETGLDHRIELVDVHRGAQFREAFRRISPNHKVPVILDADGPDHIPVTISESGAILIYLAEKTGAFLPAHGAARSAVLQWLMLQLTAIGPMFGQFNHFRRYASGETYSLARYTTQARRLYDLLEARCAESAYLAGPDYSIADVATFPWVRVESLLFGAAHPVMDAEWAGHPNLTRWYHQVAERPGVQAAIAAFEARTSSIGCATPDDLDLYYGRGAFSLTLDA